MDEINALAGLGVFPLLLESYVMAASGTEMFVGLGDSVSGERVVLVRVGSLPMLAMPIAHAKIFAAGLLDPTDMPPKLRQRADDLAILGRILADVVEVSEASQPARLH